RHTRSYGDWSSDVCSSDLAEGQTSIGGYGYPDCVNVAEDCALSQLSGTCNRAEHLVNHMVPRVYRQVADHVVKPGEESHVGWVRSEERRVGKEWRGWRRRR